MADYYSQQKKVILLAVLLSLVIHGIIITLLNELFQDKKVNQAKSRRPINVELVQIKPKKAIPLAKPKAKTTSNVKNKLPKPKPKPSINKKVPTSNRQTKTGVANQIPPVTSADKSTSPTQISKPIQTNINKSTTLKDSASTASGNPNSHHTLDTSTAEKSAKASAPVIRNENPVCSYCPEPRIPRRAEQRGEEGYAIYRLYVSASGRVVRVQLLGNSGHSGWNNAARRAALSYTFKPMSRENTKDIYFEMRSR